MSRLAIISCHNCERPTLSGFTCPICRDAGHTDLNCKVCDAVAIIRKIVRRPRGETK
jgi:hypothetical protein